MSMSSKSKSEGITEIQATASQAETGDVSVGNSSLTRKSDVAHTKSISNGANNQAANWTIGSRRNADSTEGCC